MQSEPANLGPDDANAFLLDASRYPCVRYWRARRATNWVRV